MESCNLCGGKLCLLGELGATFLAVRCRDCGHDQLVEADFPIPQGEKNE